MNEFELNRWDLDEQIEGRETRPAEFREVREHLPLKACEFPDYQEVKDDILENYREWMMPERIRRLEESEIEEAVRRYSPQEYRERFPGVPEKVLAHFDNMTDTVHVKENDHPGVLKHALTHESFHQASFLGTRRIETENQVIEVRVSGIREIGEGWSRNTGLNEGLTEMWTLKALERRKEIEAIDVVRAYSDLRRMASELKDIVGESVLKDAYFGGKIEVLRNEVNWRTRNYEGFERMTQAMDTMNRTQDLVRYQNARLEVTRLMLDMRRNQT